MKQIDFSKLKSPTIEKVKTGKDENEWKVN